MPSYLRVALLALSVSTIAACGKNTAPDNNADTSHSTASTSTPASPAADVTPSAGEKTFKAVCSMCHQTGAGGAPVFGNKEDWAPRIAQGKDTLYKHALGGFTGNKGTMPAKGGSASLADDDVKAAVDYMVSKAQ